MAVTRREWMWLLTTGLLIGGIPACSSKSASSDKKKDSEEEDEDDDKSSKKKKKKKHKKDDDEDEGDKKKAKDDDKKKADDTPAKPAAGKPDLAKILGPKGEWVPPAFAKLKYGMSPIDAGKIIPGADKPSEFGFADVKVTDVPGVVKYEFYFAEKDKKPTTLNSVKLSFDKSLNSDAFWTELKTACIAKYGPTEEKDKILTWIGPGFTPAQLTQGIMDDGYTLDVTFPH